MNYDIVASETIRLSSSCLPPLCLLSLSAVVVNQSVALNSAPNAALQNPGVCGLAPSKACLPPSTQTDTANTELAL